MSIAGRYAEALFLAVQSMEGRGAGPASQGPEAGGAWGRAGLEAAAGVADELDAAIALLAGEPDLQAFFEHPGVAVDAKRQVLRELLAPRVRRVTLSFLQLLLDKRRLRELPAIARVYRTRVEEALGQGEARVQAARPLGREELEAIATALERRTGRKIRLSTDVRPELIGGVRIVLGDKVLDGSLRGQLERLSRTLSDRN
jgi:F-type H+-transporting ATPase subunit delta